MEKTQKDHIIKNIDRLIECTKNEEVWYTHLLKLNFISPNTLESIKNTEKTKHSRIREMYLECTKSSEFALLIQTLHNSQNDLAAKILKELFTTFTKALNTVRNRKENLIWFGMQTDTKYYKGRDKELKTIHDYWIESYCANTLIFVGITGLGGIGKSELAKKYAYKFYIENQGHCVWINAENGLAFNDSIHKLAKEIGVLLQDSLGNEKTTNSLIVEVFKRLSMENSLVVFDNLENYKEEFLQYFVDYATKIQPMKPKPFVILTSRHQLVIQEFGFLAKPLELSVLALNSSVSFFQDALKISTAKLKVLSDLQSLFQELDNFPLAMQQAAAYINEMQRNSDAGTEIKEYLKIFKTESKNLLEYPVPKYQNSDSFSKPTYLTWQITLDKLSLTPKIGPVVILALNIISFFQLDNISLTLLESIIRLAVSKSANLEIASYEVGVDIFQILSNYSMCQLNKFDSKVYLSVHRLVQMVSQIKLRVENKWVEMLNMLIQVVDDIFQDTVTSNDIPHIVSLLKYTKESTCIILTPQKFYNLLEKLQNKFITTGLYREGKIFGKFAIRQINEVYGDQSRQTLRIMSHHGNTLLRCGAQNQAEKLLTGVYNTQLKHFKESSSSKEMEDTDILYTKDLLARIWLHKGNYDNALKMYLEVLDVRQRVLGTDHPDTLTIKNYIAVTYRRKGNYDEALKMYLEVLDVSERVLGFEHPDTLHTKNSIAVAHHNKGNFDESLKMNLAVLGARQRVLGFEHPDTLITRNNIAVTHRRKGNIDEALKMNLEVLDVRQRVLGFEHPDTLNTKNSIAVAYDNKGNYDGALKMYLEVLEIRQRVLGFEHPDTLMTKNSIAVEHDNKGDYDEARKLFLEVLDIRKRVLGCEHPDTLNTMNGIAVAHDNKGDYDDALKIYSEVLDVRQRVLGTDHPDTLITKNDAAVAHDNKGNYDTSLKMYLEILDVRQRVLGCEHPDTLNTKNGIAVTHRRKGNYNEALKMNLEVLEVMQRVLGCEHPDTLNTKNSIAMTHDYKGNYDKALQMYLEVLEVRQRVLGTDHPHTLNTKNNIAVTHDNIGKYDEALKMYLEVLYVRERILGFEHPDTLTTKNNIAKAHNNKANYDEALKIYLEVLDVRQPVLGTDHPDTLATKNNIAVAHDKKGNYNEALKMYLEVLDVRQRVLGFEHPDTSNTMKCFAATKQQEIIKNCVVM